MRTMGEKKMVILITTGLILLAATFFYTVQGEAEDYRATISPQVQVEQTWKLPKALKEVSGMAFLESGQVACVQDEDGSIYIYNLKSSKIEKEIQFAGDGDFEGIAVNDQTAYVLRADGTIFKIMDFMGSPKTEEFTTSFTAKNDLEGLFFDRRENRLLISVKEKDPHSKDFKGIYAVEPSSMNVKQEPVYKLTIEDPVFEEIAKKNAEDTFFPSEIGRDPKSGNLMVLEGREPRLIVLDPQGKPLSLHRLNRKLFPQPEGLSFDPSGNMYISSEGNPGTIHRVSINQK